MDLTFESILLLVQVLANALLSQVDQGDRWFLSFCVCFHLLNVRFLLHPANFVVVFFVGEALLDYVGAESHVFSLSNFLKSCVFSYDVVICSEAALFHGLEYVLLIEGENCIFQVVLKLQIQSIRGHNLSWVKSLSSLLHCNRLFSTRRKNGLVLVFIFLFLILLGLNLEVLEMGLERRTRLPPHVFVHF